MAPRWTTDQVLALAPDAASANAGRGLANDANWRSVGQSERAIWGECQGSGKNPYKTRIDLTGPAFKCSCASRKFPCKHALALFLLAVERAEATETCEPPDWVTDWLASREERAAKGSERGASATTREADPEAKAKREAQREQRVADGLDRLERWLLDVAGEGLAAAHAKPRSFWEEVAAAMVDAQCPGLAAMVRAAESAVASGEGWQRRLLDELARLWLLVRAARAQQDLPEPLRADVRALVGYPMAREDVLTSGAAADAEWAVVGRVIAPQPQLVTQRTWLWNADDESAALILDFAPAGRPLDVSLVVGTAFRAELAFYPSAAPERALVKSRGDAAPVALGDDAGAGAWRDAFGRVAETLAANPWRRRVPLTLRNARAVRDSADRWWIIDAHGEGAPLSRRTPGLWTLLARVGARPATLFGEWDGASFLPLSAWRDGHFIDLCSAEVAS
jgi:hypothetical protein